MLACPRFTLGAAAALAIACLAPRQAEACAPLAPGLYFNMPKDGETYPANAALFFSGQSISLDKVKVTVGGAPAKLTPVDDAKLQKLAGIVARLDPAPSPGQAVHVSGDFCTEGSCDPVSIQFTAGPDDTTVPTTPTAPIVNVYDYADFKATPGDCQIDSDLSYWLHTGTTPAKAGEAPVALFVEAFHDAELLNLAFTEARFINAPETTFEFQKQLEALKNAAPPKAYTFRITALDAANNVAAGTPTEGLACHYRADANGASQSGPAEPAWTTADIYPEGPCGDGSGEGGSGGSGGQGGSGNGGSGGGAQEGENDASCGCKTPGGQGTADLGGYGLATIAIALSARRRRSARAR
jgi:hypothetical protein